MKRNICLVLALVMMLCAFTGCGSEEPTGAASNEATGSEALPDGPATLTVGIPQNSNVADYYENAFTKYLEETANVKLEFVLFPTSRSEYLQQLALMCSAKEELPDVFYLPVPDSRKGRQ